MNSLPKFKTNRIRFRNALILFLITLTASAHTAPDSSRVYYLTELGALRAIALDSVNRINEQIITKKTSQIVYLQNALLQQQQQHQSEVKTLTVKNKALRKIAFQQSVIIVMILSILIIR